jgi:hypothetical protein
MRIKRLTIVAFFTIINLSVLCQNNTNNFEGFVDFFGDLPEFPGGDNSNDVAVNQGTPIIAD